MVSIYGQCIWSLTQPGQDVGRVLTDDGPGPPLLLHLVQVAVLGLVLTHQHQPALLEEETKLARSIKCDFM